MSRVAISELIFKGSNPVRTASGKTVYVYRRGTETQATLYAAETGEATVSQPLTTNSSGLPTSNGAQVWVEPGSYSLDVVGQSNTPWEAPSGAAVAVLTEAPLNVEYPEYGADGTGVSDSTEAFQKAIAALPAEGGEIFAPGRYKLSGQLNFDEKRAVRLVGQSSSTAGNSPRSQLLFSQAGSSALISARSSVGFGMSDLGVFYNNGSLTGAVLDLSHGTAATDSAFGSFERCNFVGLGVRSALGVNLDKAIVMAFRDCIFNNLDVAVKGKAEKTGYSNAMKLDHCMFEGMGTIPIKNAGSSWNLSNCVFENLNGGAAGACSFDAEFEASGMRFDTCHFNDANTSGTWITFRGKGLTVQGGALGSGALGISVPDSTSDGLVVMGVFFTSITKGIEANFGAGTQRYIIGGNTFNSVSGKKVSLDNGTTDKGTGFLSSANAKRYDVSEFGAVGNETTDDTTAIRAAMEAAGSAGGGIVFFPAGTYKISAPLEVREKVTLKGVGPASKVILANGSNCDVIKSANAGSGGADFTIIEDLWLDGNKANNPSGGCGINLDGRRTAGFRVWIFNCKEDGLKVRRTATQLSNAEGASDQIFIDIYPVNNEGNGIVNETNDVSFSHCRAAANKLAGFKTATGGVATIFNDCHAWGASEYGFNFEGSWDCVNCQAEGASVGEVRAKAGGRWTGGRLFVAGAPENTPGFLIVENGSQVQVSNCVIKETGTGGAFKAMGANVGSGSSFNFLLEGGASTTAFTLAEGASWSGNIHIEPILRGSTTIGTPPGPNTLTAANELTLTSNCSFFAVGGATEIKKIKATYAGHIVTLKFSSTPTVADGENLKLKENFVATADDTLTLACDGTNFYELTRSAN